MCPLVVLHATLLVAGGEANRAAVAADVRGGGGDLTRFAHPSSGFGGIGVNIVLRERGSSKVSLWGPRYEDPGSLEEVPNLLDVGDGKKYR